MELSDSHPPLNSDPERKRDFENDQKRGQRGSKKYEKSIVVGEDGNEEEDGVGAHMKEGQGGSHCATHPRGADIMSERQASRR